MPASRSEFSTWLSLVALALIGGACGGGSIATTQTTSSPLCAADPGPAPLRRITRFEYGRTMAALTGVDPSVAQTLPPDEETMDFDDIAAAYSVSSLHAADYLQVAEQAAAALVADSARLIAYAGCDPSEGAPRRETQSSHRTPQKRRGCRERHGCSSGIGPRRTT